MTDIITDERLAEIRADAEACARICRGFDCEASDILALLARLDKAEEALKTADLAINDWVATYAADMCGEKAVAEASARIANGGGTLMYTAHVQQLIRDCLPPNPIPKED